MISYKANKKKNAGHTINAWVLTPLETAPIKIENDKIENSSFGLWYSS
jgi:hypothetical protein